jgi:hypothetical protein
VRCIFDCSSCLFAVDSGTEEVLLLMSIIKVIWSYWMLTSFFTLPQYFGPMQKFNQQQQHKIIANSKSQISSKHNGKSSTATAHLHAASLRHHHWHICPINVIIAAYPFTTDGYIGTPFSK